MKKHLKYFHQLENHYLFKPLQVEVYGIKAVFSVHDCVS